MTERHDELTERDMTEGESANGNGADVDVNDDLTDEMNETVEVRRFADSLDVLAAGDRLDLDPAEDPELSQLVATSVAVADAITTATETPRFHSYRLRSRAAIIGQLQPATPEPQPLHFWQRRWMNLFAPVAAAAAAAALTLAFVIATDDPAPVTPTAAVADISPEDGIAESAVTEPPEDLLTLSTSLVDRIEAIKADLQELELRTNNGELVTADFLRALTERHATVAADIANAAPGSLPDGIATSAFSATIISSAVLEGAKTDAASTGALEAARQQSQHARQVAENYLVATQFTITQEAAADIPPLLEQDELPIEIAGDDERF